MRKSLFDVLRDEGLTSLKLRYDFHTDKEYIVAAKEWDDSIQWRNFNKTFFAESLLTDDDIYLNNKQTRALYEKYGLSDYVAEVFDLLRNGKFFGLDCYYNNKKDMRFTANLHNVSLGINNRDHATYTGGIRRHELNEEEIDVITDGLNLGRAQSHKNVLAKLPYGGGKITVQANQVDLNDKEELGFLAFAIDRVKFFTGPDMNYPLELADAMKEFSRYIGSGPSTKLGSSGTPTAYGATVAMKQAVKFKFGKDDLKDLKIAVMGLGSVGFAQAEFLIDAGADLIVCDMNSSAIKRLKDKHPEAKIAVVGPDEILNIEADILCPCAIGGFLTEDVINNLKFKMVFGAANNQLHANNKQEELRLAKILENRGILYQECWVQNIGGVMCGAESYIYGNDADEAALYDRIDKLCSETTWKNLNDAKALGITPTENAYKNVEDKIYR
ncbi:MAG: Glu/Leu/Phe/Val dehydrogenase dimerization domain-containing protein [Clostridiaceae bacterium]